MDVTVLTSVNMPRNFHGLAFPTLFQLSSDGLSFLGNLPETVRLHCFHYFFPDHLSSILICRLLSSSLPLQHPNGRGSTYVRQQKCQSWGQPALKVRVLWEEG